MLKQNFFFYAIIGIEIVCQQNTVKINFRSRDIECHLVTPEEAKKLCPIIRVDDLIGGIWIPDDGVADPYKTCIAFMREAQSLGKLFSLFHETYKISS